MSHVSKFLFASLAACIIANTALAQQIPSTSTAAAAAPVAYVYVDSFVSSTSSHIYAYSAASNGQLTPISGSPFVSPVNSIALNGKWLFGTYGNSQGQDSAIYTYSIAANGSLTQADILSKSDISSDLSLVDPTLDHTGSSLYTGYTDGTGDNGYESFSIDQTNGQLTPLNALATAVDAYGFLSFTGNNDYLYGASCYNFTANIYGFARMSDGALTQVAMDAPLPPSPPNTGYCPVATAADPYNDVVVPLYQYPAGGGNPGNFQLAVYTADSYGNLATTSTYQNMPTALVQADYVAMSPKGYYLAATGPTGLQIFLMHGSKPLTALTGAILPAVNMGKALWDNNEHLYVSTRTELYVFTVSTNGTTQVPGSPYSIPSLNSLIILPK